MEARRRSNLGPKTFNASYSANKALTGRTGLTMQASEIWGVRRQRARVQENRHVTKIDRTKYRAKCCGHAPAAMGL